MPVGLDHPQSLLIIEGIRLSASSANIYKEKRNDIALIEISDDSAITAAFTKNHFCAAPVKISKDNLNESKPRYCLINAGNANAGTGESGIQNARIVCEALANLTHCSKSEILPFSTGVIGEDLPVEKINKVLPSLLKNLSGDHWLDVAKSIMTTDTIPKAVSRQVKISNSTISITGIAKGSGMIKPNMATMLSFLATDANVTKDCLDEIKNRALEKSFNRIVVDGDTSTNDSFILISTCRAKNSIINKKNSKEFTVLENEITKVCCSLAQAIVRDGEGATKFISIVVEEGKDEAECLSVAYSIAQSPLVKTAFTASDPNWGRIIAAIGNANVDKLDIAKVNIHINNVCVVDGGERSKTYTEEEGKRVMMEDEIILKVSLKRGACCEEVWTTDLSYEYVKINSEYRS